MYFGARLLILDEPTSALSVREPRAVLDFVRETNERGSAAIVISHNIHHMLPISDRVVVLHQGEVTDEFDRSEAEAARIETVILHGRE